MLIYCSRVFLVPKSPVDALLSIVASWLGKKTAEPFTVADLQTDGRRSTPDSYSVDWIRAHEADANFYGIRYRHPDRHVRQRHWITEVGIRHDENSFICTVLLRTEESSALVDTNVETTRPVFVRDIFRHCEVASETSGGNATSLRLNDAEAFLFEVNNPDRTHPIVQVSYARDGQEVVSPNYLAEMLAGVATVATIPHDEDTFELENALDRRLCCFDGAINIIWPRIRTASGELIAPNYRMMRPQLLDMRARGLTLEKEILAVVCHRMNEIFARDHLTIERVRSVKHRAALAEAKSSTANDPETIKLFKRVDEDQIAEIASLKAQLKDRDDSIASLQTELHNEQSAVQSLKHNLESLSSRSTSHQTITAEDREAIAKAICDPTTVHEALSVLSKLYPERLVVLDSAWKSAKDAAKFKHPRKAFELLNLLCTTYWQSLVDGKSDADARQCFGQKAFSARESETVESNGKARSLRTFQYNGRSVEMMAHLKIGVKPSVAETFRAHFHWDVSSRLIVLGHCGEHLDHG